MPARDQAAVVRLPLFIAHGAMRLDLDQDDLLREAGFREAELRDPDARVPIAKLRRRWPGHSSRGLRSSHGDPLRAGPLSAGLTRSKSPAGAPGHESWRPRSGRRARRRATVDLHSGRVPGTREGRFPVSPARPSSPYRCSRGVRG